MKCSFSQTSPSSRLLRRARAPLLGALAVMGGVGQLTAGTTTWTWNSGTSGTPWSAAAWTKSPAGGATSPSTLADDIRFGATGRTTSDIAGNVVDQNFTLGSLAYINEGNNAGDWQVTQIGTGVTLTLAGANTSQYTLWVGAASAGTGTTARYTQSRIFGSGSLLINNAAADLKVANKYGVATLDLSGLAHFEATTRDFLIGSAPTTLATADAAGSIATVSLAAESTIVAQTLAVGSNSANLWGLTTTLSLGAETVLHTGEIRIGSGGSFYSDSKGAVAFQSSVIGQEGTKVTIRGAAGGETRAELNLGVASAASRSQNLMEGVLDFTGGEVDARLGGVTIGLGRGNGSFGAVNAVFKMDRGLVDALTVLVGGARSATTDANAAAEGLLSVAGGVFRAEELTLGEAQSGARQAASGKLEISGGLVEVANGVTVGSKISGSTANATATASVVLTGGTLRIINGNLAEGEGTVASSLTLEGGTLDLNGNEAGVDTLAIRSGTLRNIGGIRSGAVEGYTKTTAGVLVLEGVNDYLGQTQVAAGVLRVNGTLSQSTVNITSGARLEGHGTISGSVGGAGTIDPGSSPGVLTIGQLSPAGGLGFNFEFNSKNEPMNWLLPANDVLRLSDAVPLTSALTNANVISLFLSAGLFGSLQEGDTVQGGFYADNGGGFLSLVKDATFNVYYEDAAGSFSYCIVTEII